MTTQGRDTAMDELPAEIADLRDLFATAAANTEAADTAQKAAVEDFRAASNRLDQADSALMNAEMTERQARRDYVAALRKHGYVQTADGPRPADAAAERCEAAGCTGEHPGGAAR